jgi:hypothetical protein
MDGLPNFLIFNINLKKMLEEGKAIEFLKSIKPLVEQIALIQHQAYYEYKPKVETLISSGVRDDNSIQHLLDHLLDHACNDEILELYKKLCRYYWDINPQATVDYVNYYRAMWDNESNDDSQTK